MVAQDTVLTELTLMMVSSRRRGEVKQALYMSHIK